MTPGKASPITRSPRPPTCSPQSEWGVLRFLCTLTQLWYKCRVAHTGVPPPVGLGGCGPSISQRGETPHMTAISLRTYFLGAGPTSRHQREPVPRLTSKWSIRKSRGDCRLQATGESGQHSRALGTSCMYTRSCEACSYYRTWRRLGHRVSHRVVSQVPSSGSGR